ncbi:unnamed protein product [Rotaria socialis]
MELAEIFYKKSDFIETTSGNKVCRRSIMCGSQNIVLQGKTIVMADCIVRGDLAAVKIGKNCVIGEKCVIRPPFKKFAKATIGSYVHIGKNSVIGRRCIIMDCSYILPNTVIPPETVIPSYTVYGGSPSAFVEDFPETAKELMMDVTQSFYQNFRPIA